MTTIMHEIKTGNRDQQRGAVLIVALIMLLLLTLVGVAGIRDTQLQEKMAGGSEDRSIAFQAAESALREAEMLIAGGSCTGLCAANGYYELVTMPVRVDDSGDLVSESEYWNTWFGGDGNADGIADDWSDNTKVKAYAGTALPNVESQPLYVIELLPPNYSAMANTTNAGASGTGTSTIKDYLITARGTGRTSTAVVILQSLYRYSSPVTP